MNFNKNFINKGDNILNIVFASDDNYVPLLSVCMISLLENNSKDFDNINIFILDNNINKNNKIKLKSIINNYNAHLKFININVIEKIEGITPIIRDNNLSYSTYSRLFIASLLPKDINKVLYLDCDSLVCGSFKELWELNIKNYSCAAVYDQYNMGSKFLKELLNLNKDGDYYNSGLLLINLDYWRKNNIESDFTNYLTKNKSKIWWHDQDVINAVLKDSILPIDIKYNLMSCLHELNIKSIRKWQALWKFYDEKMIENAQKTQFSFILQEYPFLDHGLVIIQNIIIHIKNMRFYLHSIKKYFQITNFQNMNY